MAQRLFARPRALPSPQERPPARRCTVRTSALLAALLAAVVGCSADRPSFRIGYMVCNSLSETQERFAPLTAYLSEATGARFEAAYLDTVDVESTLARGEVDFTHTNSLLYVTLHARHGLRLVAAEKRGAFGSMTRGAIITRRNSGIATLADLRGKRFVFGPQWAPFGFLAEYALLLDAAIDPERDLGYYAIPHGSWKHEKIIYSVLYGAFDAGAAPLIDLEEMTAEGKIAPDDLTVLARTDLAPYCTVGAAVGVDTRWVERVREVLLALDEKATGVVGAERLAVLHRARVTGFEALRDEDYDILRKWAKAARLPPYEEY
ncbi:MAG: phosphate/phosphite/phosphonate ABC transporter substrate-binding protein [Proteobacteria bacterium]|nr:phosphate/phosphite/phosphonate ABC transporter substrate-binding protein [Pseudomonadota bacterium]